MARNKRLKLTPASSGGSKGVYAVVDRETGKVYGKVYVQGQGGYRVRLSHYAHTMSKVYASKDQVLDYVEKEVF